MSCDKDTPPTDALCPACKQSLRYAWPSPDDPTQTGQIMFRCKTVWTRGADELHRSDTCFLGEVLLRLDDLAEPCESNPHYCADVDACGHCLLAQQVGIIADTYRPEQLIPDPEPLP